MNYHDAVIRALAIVGQDFESRGYPGTDQEDEDLLIRACDGDSEAVEESTGMLNHWQARCDVDVRPVRNVLMLALAARVVAAPEADDMARDLAHNLLDEVADGFLTAKEQLALYKKCSKATQKESVAATLGMFDLKVPS